MKLFVLVILCLKVSVGHTQNIQGTYQEKKTIGEGTLKITFNKGTFTEQSTGDMLTKLGYGNYTLKNGILTLRYRHYPKQDTSSYELEVLGPSPSSIIELAIFDSERIPMFGVFGCRDFRNQVLNTVSTDKNGMGNITIFNNPNIGTFTIDNIGYHRITIPIKKLMHRRIKIKAYLKPQTNYYIEPSIKTYKVIKIKGNELILSKNDLNYNFEKVE